MRYKSLLVLCSLFLISCDDEPKAQVENESTNGKQQVSAFSDRVDAEFQPLKEDKTRNEDIKEKNECHTKGFRILNGQKTAICNGVRMYVRSQTVASTYKRALENINRAKENNSYEILPSGATEYDFGKVIGLELPQDQVSTANEEPVFFSCVMRLKSCRTHYLYKKNLEIMYDPQTHWLEEDGSFQKIDKNYREVVDEFIRDNPEFYTEKDRGE